MPGAVLRITSTTALVYAVMVLTVARAADFTWDGNGDLNNGGNWSTAANWNPDGVPSNMADTAELQIPSALRYVSNTVPTTIGALTMGGHANNHLWLDADLTVSNFLGAGWQAFIHMNGQTLTVYQGQANYLPHFTDGGGLFRKLGPGNAYAPNDSIGYSGDWEIEGGTFNLTGGTAGRGGSTNMTIHDGARVRIASNPFGTGLFPTHVRISGDGGGLGVLDNDLATLNFEADLIVESDALITTGNGQSMNLQGQISGPGGTLTFDGNVGGDFDVSGIGSTYSNNFIVKNGTVVISGSFPNLTNILVDAGGVLEGLQSQFPNATVTLINGGVWIQNLSATWTGLGDGSNWTDTANWSPEIVPSDTATIPVPASLQTVFVDAPTTVAELVMSQTPNNHVRLGANLTITNVAGGGAWMSHFELNGHTLTVHQAEGTYLPNFSGGGGLFVKVGPGTVYSPNSSSGYSGDYIISNGLMVVGGGVMGQGGSALMTVHDGASVLIFNGNTTAFPGSIVIYGDGIGQGVIRNGNKQHFYPDITVASDALINNEANVTFKMHGDIDGPGCLTLKGTGNPASAIEVAGMGSTYSNKFIVTNCTVVISGNLPNITNIWVDAGGVLEGLQVQFPNATVTLTNGGVWNQTFSATWTGNGDGSNWTDTANWSPQIVPTDTATYPVQGSPEIIFVDAPATVDTFAMGAHANNRLRLGANLTVSNFTGGAWQAYVEMNGYTFTIWQADGTYLPNFTGGGGRFVKLGPGSCYSPNSSIGYSGDYIISGGLLSAGGGIMGQGGSTNMTIHDGARLLIYNTGQPAFPSNVVIYGNGGGLGTIRNASITFNFHPDLHVASDASIYNAADNQTFIMHGDITGPGTLTFGADPGASFDLNGTYDFVINGASGNMIIADSGEVDIADATITVSGEENAGGGGLREFIIVDYSGGGTVVGKFGATNDLKINWIIDYDGTEDNPDAVVLFQLPTTGSVLEFE